MTRLKSIQALLVVGILIILGAALLIEYHSGLQPCPLCLTQRLCAFLFMFVAALSLCFKPQVTKCFLWAQGFFASLGLFFALRQTYLQLLPSHDTGVCMPGLEQMIRFLPWTHVAQALLWGASDCAEVAWRFLGLSLAEWSALFFVILIGMTIYLYRQTKTHS